MSDYGVRIRAVRKWARLFQKEFGKLIGVSDSYLSQVEKGQAKPNAQIFEGIARNFPDINLTWLLTGEKSMLDESYLVATESRTIMESFSIDKGMVGIPFLDGVPVSAGYGSLISHENPTNIIYFNEELLWSAYGVRPGHLALLPVEGQSMEPTIRAGELVLIDQSPSATLPADGIFVVRLEGDLLVKQLQRLPGGIIKVRSENPAYDPFTINMKDESIDFKIIAKVMLSLRKI